MLKIIPFIYDDYDDLCANTYVVFDDDKSCIVIDPSKDYQGIAECLKKNSLNLKAILITHGHFDHMNGINNLLNNFDCELVIGFNDEDCLTNTNMNLSKYMGKNLIINKKATTCCESDNFDYLKERIYVLDTPYHTKGSVSYYFKNQKVIFTGDSLFKQSIGRSDFPNSCHSKFKDTINKLMSLDKDYKVYPGHGEFTTIKDELNSNPFVKR